ncbi:hypothetical protein [Paenibacillus flagellatus]|uniref:Uncharacterized protein n=1 Tax=Paenibacillus flagellatus TaxID=2211139 RepID=A0A2V5KUG8_9BACL|nr:hypothetical protein [Paenibacillus flagellatus]PYI52996.1 hypothetical protein DLM86_18525 [Paenibacillus flagellatus]
MKYKATFVMTLFGIALCLFNYSGLDPDNIFLFMFSIPVWLIEIVGDIHYFNVFVVYLLTVASYALLGRIGDYYRLRRRARS